MCLNHFPICLKLKQHHKSIIPQLKKVKLVNHQHKNVFLSPHPLLQLWLAPAQPSF